MESGELRTESCMGIPIYQVDAFTSEMFKGNPAGVCVLNEERSSAWMQDFAAEMNLSETAFLVKRGGENNAFGVRFFTPTVEVPLCGHVTLASSYVLWEDGYVKAEDPITFYAQHDRLTASREENGIKLNFPALGVRVEPEPFDWNDTLGGQPSAVYDTDLLETLVEFSDADFVRSMEPKIDQIAKSKHGTCIVTAKADTDACDFVSRCFDPGVGIDEDPVTGSAHCVLGPFWAERLGRTKLVGHQVSKRGGVVGVEVVDDRVNLFGEAVMVFKGELSGE